jgi:hypothetical protein
VRLNGEVDRWGWLARFVAEISRREHLKARTFKDTKIQRPKHSKAQTFKGPNSRRSEYFSLKCISLIIGAALMLNKAPVDIILFCGQ